MTPALSLGTMPQPVAVDGSPTAVRHENEVNHMPVRTNVTAGALRPRVDLPRALALIVLGAFSAAYGTQRAERRNLTLRPSPTSGRPEDTRLQQPSATTPPRTLLSTSWRQELFGAALRRSGRDDS
jgi:hypothetical protein